MTEHTTHTWLQSQPMAQAPFATTGQHALVAVWGGRVGYVQVAPAHQCETYSLLPFDMLTASRDWAARLEALGAKRVYWVTLSEQVRHLHIHLYPRWSDDETDRGTALFDARHTELANPQPWPSDVLNALAAWARHWDVALLPTANQPLAAKMPLISAKF
jgi:diadenosine tetraphosphate (Ap4A) HIT family hydrolase